jgi:hypothetical protein
MQVHMHQTKGAKTKNNSKQQQKQDPTKHTSIQRNQKDEKRQTKQIKLKTNRTFRQCKQRLRVCPTQT